MWLGSVTRLAAAKYNDELSGACCPYVVLHAAVISQHGLCMLPLRRTACSSHQSTWAVHAAPTSYCMQQSSVNMGGACCLLRRTACSSHQSTWAVHAASYVVLHATVISQHGRCMLPPTSYCMQQSSVNMGGACCPLRLTACSNHQSAWAVNAAPTLYCIPGNSIDPQ